MSLGGGGGFGTETRIRIESQAHCARPIFQDKIDKIENISQHASPWDLYISPLR